MELSHWISQSPADDLKLLVQRTAVRPGLPDNELLKAVLAFSKDDQLGLRFIVNGPNSDRLALFESVVADTRLPGWARLLMALRVDLPHGDLAKYVPKLVEVASGTHLAIQNASFLALSPTRRLRLAHAKLATKAYLAIADLPGVVQAAQRSTWSDVLTNLAAQVGPAPDDLPASLDTILGLDLPSGTLLELVAGVNHSSRGFSNHFSLVVPILLDLINKAPDTFAGISAHLFDVHMDRSKAVISTLMDRPEPAAHLLAAKVASSDTGVGLDVLLCLAGSKHSALDAVKLASRYNRPVLPVVFWPLLAKLVEVNAADAAAQLVGGSGIRISSDNVSDLAKIFDQLGSEARRAFLVPVFEGTVTYGDRVLDLLPAGMLSEICTGAADHQLDSLRAKMVRRSLRPAGGLAGGITEVLTQSLEHIMLHQESWEQGQVTLAAWLRVLPAPAAVRLVQANKGPVPPAVADFLDEALAAAGTGLARDVLGQALDHRFTLPKGQTLVAYLNGLRSITERL